MWILRASTKIPGCAGLILKWLNYSVSLCTVTSRKSRLLNQKSKSCIGSAEESQASSCKHRPVTMGRRGLCLDTEANTWTGSVSGGRSSHWLHPPSSGLSSQVVILGPLQILTPPSRLSQRWTALVSILTVLQMPPLPTSSELLYLLYYRFWDLRGNASPAQLEGTSTYF